MTSLIRHLLCIAITLSCVMGSGVLAQENESNSGENKTPVADVNTDREGAGQTSTPSAEQKSSEEDSKQGDDSTAANGDFIPSEEISEDVPVSFPVDI